jgi:hypothetical protein
MDQNQERRRGHFHRSRRGPDRRGVDRRTPPQTQEQAARDHVDVEQIMRDIRARIAQRQGADLSNQQIEELATRRLEAILDPRTMKPALLDQMRGAAGRAERPEQTTAEPAYAFGEDTIYESHRGVLRFVRRLLNPLLKLFFNPAPLAGALEIQAKLNVEAAARDAERERRQAEWNALHYEIVRRLVTEVSRASIELQTLSTRIESLSAKVDFNERRVRTLEGAMHQARPAGRPAEAAPAGAAPPEAAVQAESGAEPALSGESARRRRRRRRGRRGSGTTVEGAPPPRPLDAEAQAGAGAVDAPAPNEAGGAEPGLPPVTTEGESIVQAQEREEPAVADSDRASAWQVPAEAPQPDRDPSEG